MTEHETAISSLTKAMNGLDDLGHELSFLADAVNALWKSEATGLSYLLVRLQRGLDGLPASIGDALEVLAPPVPVAPQAPALEPQLTEEQRDHARQLLQPAFEYLDEVALLKAQPEPA